MRAAAGVLALLALLEYSVGASERPAAASAANVHDAQEHEARDQGGPLDGATENVASTQTEDPARESLPFEPEQLAENENKVDPNAGRERLEAALRLGGVKSFETVRDALEQVATDETASSAVRGSALAEIARALENVYPSFAMTERNEGVWFGSSIQSFDTSGSMHVSLEHNNLDRVKAVEYYERAAALGNETAQFRMGTLYATGALGVRQDLARAVLYYYFASMGGSLEASMALGFRHSIGLGVPKDCKAAVVYYELAANQVVDSMEASGLAFLNDRKRLDMNSKSSNYPGRNPRGEDAEIVDYYEHAAENGDLEAYVGLGQIYYYGARGIRRNLKKALSYFRAAASRGDASAQAMIGHMLVRGQGTEQDLTAAFGNFSKSADGGSANGLNGLGFMYLYGLGVKRDVDKARKLFGDAAESGNPEAYYNLGALYVSGVGVRRRNYPTALNYFSMAAQKGHVLAMHKLAQMHLHGIGTGKNCDHAVNLFKAVAERGETILLLQNAFSFYKNEYDATSALHSYLVAAELGYEVAQANAAWLLDENAELGVPDSGSEGSETEANPDATVAIFNMLDSVHEQVAKQFPGLAGSEESLRLYQLAAEQGNVDARLRTGDFYYYGLTQTPDYELAAHHYKQASDAQSATANFNLGFMHQHGIGLPRDFHLAKRYFDAAASLSPEAAVPVSMALTGLWLHRLYLAVVYQEVGSDLPNFAKTLARWARPFVGVSTEQGSDVAGEESGSGAVTGTGTETETEAASMSGENNNFGSELWQSVQEIEDDTIVAICLFVLLVIVLLMRSREQQRAFHERQRGHLHAD
mmetsp:Transcript_2273/g.4335  ORF Transcript_2273/g.4335 Transcript_2273/m.4335 type:complete len:815 (+) Transcript_2273:320-2764(+)